MTNHPEGRVRTCETTGLSVCLEGQRFIKLNAVLAVIFLLIGGIGAILLILTRWPAVHLLNDTWYYRIVTLHGLNMLIFWIIFFEIAVLYFAGTVLLKSRLASTKGRPWSCTASSGRPSMSVSQSSPRSRRTSRSESR